MKPSTPAPLYVSLYPMLADAARKCGYALAVHGSVTRDFDLIAVPWTDDAGEPLDLIRALAESVGAKMDTMRAAGHTWWTPTVKPHGRRAWSIHLWGDGYLDVSVMPRIA